MSGPQLHIREEAPDWSIGLRGRLREQVPLADTNWFRVGGNAEYLFKPEDTADLATFLKQKPADLPVTVIGVGSNLLVRDGGIDGVVVRLGRGFATCEVESEKKDTTTQEPCIIVGASCLDINAAQFAAENNIGGLEFLSGIPGTIGGAVKMNGGAYGCDMSQVMVQVEVVDAVGEIQLLNNAQCGFSYRKSSLPEGSMVTRAWLKGKPSQRETIVQQIQDIQMQREETQPIRTRTGGSTFKNPEGHKAWELIHKAGCRGLKRGGAQVSEKHCNFLINTGNATADDLEQLGEEVRLRVKAHSGIELEWEIKRVGK